MLSFVHQWFSPKANPIGVDFGSDAVRLAQVQVVGQDHKLFAAACADVPTHAQVDVDARFDFFSETVRDLLDQGKFVGRQVVLSLPAHWMFIQHLRLPKMDDASLKQAVRWEAKGKLPLDPANALIRHVVAGEVQHENETKLEVIVMAAPRDLIDRYLAVAAKARLDVIGMSVEPRAVVDCFAHVYRRKLDAAAVNLFVDIGGSGTRATIAQGTDVLFARAIKLGGNDFNAAVAGARGCSIDDARTMRIQAAATVPNPADGRDQRNVSAEVGVDSGFALLNRAGLSDQPTTTDKLGIDQLISPVVQQIAQELLLCKRHHEAAFSTKPVERLIFVGGEARHRSLCMSIAREMGLAAQIGDPLVRMARISDIRPDSGIDRRLPQPSWSVAIGLSLGPARLADGSTPAEPSHRILEGVA